MTEILTTVGKDVIRDAILGFALMSSPYMYHGTGQTGSTHTTASTELFAENDTRRAIVLEAVPDIDYKVSWLFKITSNDVANGTNIDEIGVFQWSGYQIGISGLSGSFTANESLSFSSSGATATYVSDDGSTMNVINVSGSPTDQETITGDDSGASATIATLGKLVFVENINTLNKNSLTNFIFDWKLEII